MISIKEILNGSDNYKSTKKEVMSYIILKGYSQTDIANEMGISRQRLNAVFKRDENINEDNVEKLADEKLKELFTKLIRVRTDEISNRKKAIILNRFTKKITE